MTLQLKYLRQEEIDKIIIDFLKQLEAKLLEEETNHLLDLGQTLQQKIDLLEKFKEELKNGNK